MVRKPSVHELFLIIFKLRLFFLEDLKDLLDTVLSQDDMIINDIGCWSSSNKISVGIKKIDVCLG